MKPAKTVWRGRALIETEDELSADAQVRVTTIKEADDLARAAGVRCRLMWEAWPSKGGHTTAQPIVTETPKAE